THSKKTLPRLMRNTAGATSRLHTATWELPYNGRRDECAGSLQIHFNDLFYLFSLHSSREATFHNSLGYPDRHGVCHRNNLYRLASRSTESVRLSSASRRRFWTKKF